MQKTESILNLTKSSLYGIYNSSSTNLNQENEEVDEYFDGSKLHIKSKESHETGGKAPSRPPAPDSVPVQIWKGVAKLITVSVAAFVYNEVVKNIHTTHAEGHGALINSFLSHFVQSFSLGKKIFGRDQLTQAEYILSLTTEGLVLSLILPILDNNMPARCTTRVLSSNPEPNRRSNLPNDVIRALMAFLGISYAIRNMEWSSPLQMSLTWSLINPGLWLILDGTINGFLSSLIVAICGSALIYAQSGALFEGDGESLLSIFLFVASFFFCAVIIFGKLGRILFGKK